MLLVFLSGLVWFGLVWFPFWLDWLVVSADPFGKYPSSWTDLAALSPLTPHPLLLAACVFTRSSLSDSKTYHHPSQTSNRLLVFLEQAILKSQV
jgi:hypothetical protein